MRAVNIDSSVIYPYVTYAGTTKNATPFDPRVSTPFAARNPFKTDPNATAGQKLCVGHRAAVRNLNFNVGTFSCDVEIA